jgi:hypothetical protein
MNLIELQAALNDLVGKQMTYKRVAQNSIILYFDGEPGDKSVHSIWMDPPWRYEAEGRAVVDSADLNLDEADFESKDACNAEWQRRCRMTDSANQTPLERVEIDSASHDITVRFAGGKVFRTFTTIVMDEREKWTYRDMTIPIAVDVSPRRITVRDL